MDYDLKTKHGRGPLVLVTFEISRLEDFNFGQEDFEQDISYLAPI